MKMKKIKKILSYYKPYKKELFLDLLCSVIYSLSVAIIPLLIKYVTTNVINLEKGEAFHKLILIALVILALFAVISACQRYIKYQGNMLSVKVESDLKLEIFKHFQVQDFSFFDEWKVGKLMSYITTDAYNLTAFIKNVPEVLLDVAIRFIIAGVVLFTLNPVFGMVTYGVVTLLLTVSIYFIPKVQKELKKARNVYSELTSELEESLSGIKTVQSFTNEDEQILKFKSNMKTYIETNDRQNKLDGTLFSIIVPTVIGLIPIVTIISMFFVLNGDFSVSDLIVFMLYADILISPIFGVFSLLESFNQGVVGFKRIFGILSIKPEIASPANALHLENAKGKIEFKNVSFSYKSGRKIFENLNLKIDSGEYVALVGSSGVGKSTLCNLIPRFYDVSEGEILIDGIPIKNIDVRDLRKNIGFVQQDTFLFSGTVMENIRYGNLAASAEEVISASKNAYVHGFVSELKDGYDTQIGERGTKLSGGQKQRIAIARAFLKNPSILIFDEATSNLDNESEKFIQKSMEELASNRTTIVIAHRLSTIKNAKRILVLGENGIAEEGTHEELLDKGGIYAKLYNSQFQKVY